MLSDRAPDAHDERHARRGAHGEGLRDHAKSFHMHKNEIGGFAEQAHGLRFMLKETHQIRDFDATQPPRSGYSVSRLSAGQADACPEPYDYEVDAIRPRTVGFSTGHIRSLEDPPRTATTDFALRSTSPDMMSAGRSLSPTNRSRASTAGSTRPGTVGSAFNTTVVRTGYAAEMRRKAQTIKERRLRHQTQRALAQRDAHLAATTRDEIASFEKKLRGMSTTLGL